MDNNIIPATELSEADVQTDVKLSLPFLRNINISSKLNLGFALLILMMVAVSTMSIAGLLYVRWNFERGLDYGLELERLSLEAQVQLLQARRGEKDFLLRWKAKGLETAIEKYVGRNTQALENLQGLTREMDVILPDDDSAGTQAMRDAIKSLNIEIVTYREKFQDVIRLIGEHGHYKSGAVGRLRNDVHKVENAIKDLGLIRSRVEMLMLRRYEKDFLLRGDEKYVKKVTDRIIILKNTLKEEGADADTRQQIGTLLDNYWTSFDALAKAKRKIAIAIEKFRDAAHRIEGEANHFRDIGHGEATRYVTLAQEGSQYTILLISASVGGILLFGLVISYFLAGHIRTPIRLLDQTVQRIRGGDHQAVAPVITTDEAGRLAYAFNHMSEDLNNSMASLKEHAEELRKQREIADNLLLNILPKPIANRLKTEETIAEWHGQVTVLFADMVGFTKLGSLLSATKLVSRLNSIFTAFDYLTEKHGLEKIKTMGDCYMAVGGLPITREDHAEIVAEMALDMLPVLEEINRQWNEKVQIRIGINSGPVVAGVIGKSKFVYDLWGDTVNVASRMESHGVVGRIQVSESTYELLKEKFRFEGRGEIEIKNKGTMKVYLLIDDSRGKEADQQRRSGHDRRHHDSSVVPGSDGKSPG